MKMKRSGAFHMAQLSVLTDELIGNEEKLDILRVLQDAEDTAKLVEDTMLKRASEKE